MTRIKIQGRYVYMTEKKAIEVYKNIRAKEIKDRQTEIQIQQARVGPRKGPGSQLAGWVDSNNCPEKETDKVLVYSTD